MVSTRSDSRKHPPKTASVDDGASTASPTPKKKRQSANLLDEKSPIQKSEQKIKERKDGNKDQSGSTSSPKEQLVSIQVDDNDDIKGDKKKPNNESHDDDGEEDSKDDDDHDQLSEKQEKTLLVKPKKKLPTVRNELTSLIPGYTAARALNTSSLDRYRPTGGMTELLKKATRADKSTRDFVVDATAARNHASAMQKTANGLLPSSYSAAYSSFKKGTKRTPDLTAGAGWFDMKPTAMTDELKTDLSVIRNRSYLDPKRFYKSADSANHKVVQHGTVIEGATEFYSSRLTKKQRRTNLTEEIMADPDSADYARNKYRKMQQSKTEQAEKRKNRTKKRGKRLY